MMSHFGIMQGCFAVIPLFWPILWLQRRMIKAGLDLHRKRIRNAIDVWRDDLAGESFDPEFTRDAP